MRVVSAFGLIFRTEQRLQIRVFPNQVAPRWREPSRGDIGRIQYGAQRRDAMFYYDMEEWLTSFRQKIDELGPHFRAFVAHRASEIVLLVWILVKIKEALMPGLIEGVFPTFGHESPPVQKVEIPSGITMHFEENGIRSLE